MNDYLARQGWKPLDYPATGSRECGWLPAGFMPYTSPKDTSLKRFPILYLYILWIFICNSVINNCLFIHVQAVHFQPHTLFINRVGCSLCLQQCDSQSVAWVHPSDPPKPFGWQSSAKVELLRVCSIESSLFFTG